MVCVGDFQLFVTQLKDIISQISVLDDTTVPASAAALWDARGTPAADRSLGGLVAEYEAAVADGSWTPAPRFDIGSFLKNNTACDRLAEFAQIKYAIKRKYGEVEDKRDFDAWMQSMLTAPMPECEQSVLDEWAMRIQGLQASIAGVEDYSDFMIPQLFEDFGMPKGTLAAF